MFLFFHFLLKNWMFCPPLMYVNDFYFYFSCFGNLSRIKSEVGRHLWSQGKGGRKGRETGEKQRENEKRGMEKGEKGEEKAASPPPSAIFYLLCSEGRKVQD